MNSEFREVKRQKVDDPSDAQNWTDLQTDQEKVIEETIQKLDTRNGLIEVLKIPDRVYNPSMPNDFEMILARRRKMKKDLDKQLKQVRKIKKDGEKRMQEPNELKLDVSGEEAFMMRANKTKKATGEEKAKKMMEMMGWGGKGLGVDEQGITAPLIHQKTSKSTGKIIQSSHNHHHNKKQ